MKKGFTVSVSRGEDLFVAQCLEVDVASQGETEAEALANLREALELHFELPLAKAMPEVKVIEVEVDAALGLSRFGKWGADCNQLASARLAREGAT